MIGKLLHIVLAQLLLLSSFGLVVNKHYCQDQLKSVAFFAEAKSCHTANMPANCPMHGTSDTEDKGCCDNESEYLKADLEQFVTSPSTWPDIDEIKLPLPPFHDFHELVRQLASKPSFLKYKPPALVADLTIRLQTFIC